MSQPEVHKVLATEEQRVALRDGLEDLATKLTEHFAPILKDLLGPTEKIVQEFLDAETFLDGSWYRPIHNVIVPLAMLAILKREDAPKDLMFAAQLHDVGYSQIEIACSLEGKDYDRPDKRLAHMEVGAVMTRKLLERLADKDPSITPERIERLCFLVATHDNPYIGIPLTDRDQFLLRDADRSFVPSVVSFYKDLLAHTVDEDFRAALDRFGIRFTPQTFAEIRLAGFYIDEHRCTADLTGTKAEYRDGFTRFNPGGLSEPQTTDTGRGIADFMLSARVQELSQLNRIRDVGDLLGLFARSARAELDFLVALASQE